MQVDREHDHAQPGLVDRERCGTGTGPARCPSRSGCGPRPGRGRGGGLEVGELPDAGVGGERGVAPAVGFLERVELRAGVRAFPAHDHPHPRRVAGQRGAGSTPVSSATPAPSRVRRRRRSRRPTPRFGMVVIAARSFSVIAQPTENSQLTAVLAQAADVREELVGAARGVGADQDRGAVAVLVGHLRQRRVEDGDVVGGGVAARRSRAAASQRGTRRCCRRTPASGGTRTSSLFSALG